MPQSHSGTAYVQSVLVEQQVVFVRVAVVSPQHRHHHTLPIHPVIDAVAPRSTLVPSLAALLPVPRAVS